MTRDISTKLDSSSFKLSKLDSSTHKALGLTKDQSSAASHLNPYSQPSDKDTHLGGIERVTSF